jgi:hypothetical protein
MAPPAIFDQILNRTPTSPVQVNPQVIGTGRSRQQAARKGCETPLSACFGAPRRPAAAAGRHRREPSAGRVPRRRSTMECGEGERRDRYGFTSRSDRLRTCCCLRSGMTGRRPDPDEAHVWMKKREEPAGTKSPRAFVTNRSRLRAFLAARCADSGRDEVFADSPLLKFSSDDTNPSDVLSGQSCPPVATRVSRICVVDAEESPHGSPPVCRKSSL